MLSDRLRTDAQPRTKNGHPAQSTTGVASRNWSHTDSLWRNIAAKVEARKVRAHFQHHRGHGQRGADPEAASHVDQLGARAGFFTGTERLQRHAADRAGAGTDLADFGMHGAGVDRAFRHRLAASARALLLPRQDNAAGRR